MAAWRNMAGAMADDVIRFWAVEHVVGMLAAIAFVHVGRVRIRKTTDSRRKHFLAAIFFGLALVLMLVSIPWPFGSIDRPWIRM
jgi:ABC-type Co2+ transport system permease subunit